MWKALERIIPDVRQRTEVKLVATPLTHEFFNRRFKGILWLVWLSGMDTTFVANVVEVFRPVNQFEGHVDVRGGSRLERRPFMMIGVTFSARSKPKAEYERLAQSRTLGYRNLLYFPPGVGILLFC